MTIREAPPYCHSERRPRPLGAQRTSAKESGVGRAPVLASNGQTTARNAGDVT